MKPGDRNKGFVLAFTSAMVLSLTAIFIRYLTQTFAMPALVLAFWREIIVAAGMAVFFLLSGKNRLGGVHGHIPYLVIYGLALALFNALWTLSVSLNGASVATVLAYSSAGFTVLLGWIVLREPLTATKIIATVMSLSGCALVVNALDPAVWQVNTLGIIAGTAAGIFYAIYSIMGRSAAQRGLDPWTTLMYIFGFASVFMLSFNLLSSGRIPGAAQSPGEMLWLGREWSGWLILIALALGPTLMGYGLYNAALQHLESSITNLIVTIEPVFTAAVAYFMFGERLTMIQIIGAVLIMSAVLVLRLRKKKRRMI
jgi:drug/metabolite transporter (DMT)-like permease